MVCSRSQGGGCSHVHRASQGGGGRQRAAGEVTCLLGRPAVMICPGLRVSRDTGLSVLKPGQFFWANQDWFAQTKSTYWLPGYSFLFGGIWDRKGQCRKCDLASTDTDLKLQCLQSWAYLYLMHWFSGRDAPDKTVVGSVGCEGMGLWRKSTESTGREASCSEAAGLGLYLFICCYLYFLGFLTVLRGLQNLSSPTGIEPMPPAVEAQSLKHWTTREVPAPGPFRQKFCLKHVFPLDQALLEGWTSLFSLCPPHLCAWYTSASLLSSTQLSGGLTLTLRVMLLLLLNHFSCVQLCATP